MQNARLNVTSKASAAGQGGAIVAQDRAAVQASLAQLSGVVPRREVLPLASTATVFAFDSSAVRVVVIGGTSWFVAADVCAALAIGNTSLAVNGNPSRPGSGGVDDEDKGVATVNTPSGEQQMLVVNESGLYALIFKSRRPEARRFKKWVTAEVLPTIRKTGGYVMPGGGAMRDLVDDPVALRALVAGCTDKLVELQAALEEQAPKVAAHERLAKSDGATCVTVAAKALGLRRDNLYQWLEELGWVFRDTCGNWNAYQTRLDQGVLEHRPVVIARASGPQAKYQPLVTPKGLARLAELLSARGGLPVATPKPGRKGAR